jgi:hypothetical protein
MDANDTSTASTFRVDAKEHTSASIFVDAISRSILIVFYSFILPKSTSVHNYGR